MNPNTYPSIDDYGFIADCHSAEMLGKFPHGLTHLSLISAAVALNEIEGAEKRNSGGCKPD